MIKKRIINTNLFFVYQSRLVFSTQELGMAQTIWLILAGFSYMIP